VIHFPDEQAIIADRFLFAMMYARSDVLLFLWKECGYVQAL
jgi:hypothetical protein